MGNIKMAGILSIIYPGLGQLYNGQIRKWLKLTSLQILFIVLFPALFRIVGMVSGFLFAIGILTIIMLPFAFIPFLLLMFGLVIAPRYSAYKDAIEITNQTTKWSEHFNRKQQLIIVSLVTINEVILSIFIYEYFWRITEHMSW